MTITAEGERGMVERLAIVAADVHRAQKERGVPNFDFREHVCAVLLALREPDDWMIDPVQEVFWPYLTDDVTMDHARKVAKQALQASIQSILDRAILSERIEGEGA